jgi:hypothetical protein
VGSLRVSTSSDETMIVQTRTVTATDVILARKMGKILFKFGQIWDNKIGQILPFLISVVTALSQHSHLSFPQYIMGLFKRKSKPEDTTTSGDGDSSAKKEKGGWRRPASLCLMFQLVRISLTYLTQTLRSSSRD